MSDSDLFESGVDDRRVAAWRELTAPCDTGEHRSCVSGPARVHTETMIVRGGPDEDRFLRNYEVWHDAAPPIEVALAGKVGTDPDTLELITRLRDLTRAMLHGSPLEVLGDDEALIALVVAAYEHLLLDEGYERARFDYR